MMICHSHRFIFIHVPKVAGTSVKDVIGQELFQEDQVTFQIAPNPHYPPEWTAPYEEHITAAELKAQLAPEIWDSYFKFAFVRHPLDWAVSNYFFFLRDRKGHPAHEFLERKGFPGTIDLFFGPAGRNPLVAGMRFSQWEFLCDSEGRTLADFVGKYERLEQDFAAVCAHVGLTRPDLPRLNQTRHQPFASYYDEALTHQVRHALDRDFQIFDYV